MLKGNLGERKNKNRLFSDANPKLFLNARELLPPKTFCSSVCKRNLRMPSCQANSLSLTSIVQGDLTQAIARVKGNSHHP
jgi:hypothetical protein